MNDSYLLLLEALIEFLQLKELVLEFFGPVENVLFLGVNDRGMRLRLTKKEKKEEEEKEEEEEEEEKEEEEWMGGGYLVMSWCRASLLLSLSVFSVDAYLVSVALFSEPTSPC